jgi:KaiC/GvpD/RAD55 family RecA-like ATPase
MSNVEIDINGKCTYINKITGEFWLNWKNWDELSDEEKEKVNLITYPKNCIMFDRDLGENEKEEIDRIKINDDYKIWIEKLKNFGFKSFTSWYSAHGFHVQVMIENMRELDEDLCDEIRRFYIMELGCDIAKVSRKTVISVPNRPHFKNGKIYPEIEHIPGINKIPQEIISKLKSELSKKQTFENTSSLNSQELKDFFESDPFFNYLKNRKEPIPEGWERNNILLRELSIACAQNGKSVEEVTNILKPILERLMPDIPWSQFISSGGWYKQALKGKYTKYNKVSVNNWTSTYLGKKFYDLTMDIGLKELSLEKSSDNKLKLYWGDEINSMRVGKVEWLVENWIPVGDICFIVGKSGSYKSTIALHFGLAIANGKLIFNKHKTIQKKVLYINEEINKNLFPEFYKRVVKGLGLEKVENFAATEPEYLKLDAEKTDINVPTDIELLAKVLEKNGIGVLVLDSLRRFIGFDENDATQMNNFYMKLNKLRSYCKDLTIILIHHLKKSTGKPQEDVRDMLRGSSDIVNFSDSIIVIEKKLNEEAFAIYHGKNRAGIEMDKKIIIMDTGDRDDAYMYESTQSEDKAQSLVSICTEEIMKFLENSNLTIFSRKDLGDILTKYKNRTLTMALDSLKREGILTIASANSVGRHVKYQFNHEQKTQERKKQDKDNNEKQQILD